MLASQKSNVEDGLCLCGHRWHCEHKRLSVSVVQISNTVVPGLDFNAWLMFRFRFSTCSSCNALGCGGQPNTLTAWKRLVQSTICTLQCTLWLCSAGWCWWLVLIFYERKVLLAGWCWFCVREILLAGCSEDEANRAFNFKMLQLTIFNVPRPCLVWRENVFMKKFWCFDY